MHGLSFSRTVNFADLVDFGTSTKYVSPKINGNSIACEFMSIASQRRFVKIISTNSLLAPFAKLVALKTEGMPATSVYENYSASVYSSILSVYR